MSSPDLAAKQLAVECFSRWLSRHRASSRGAAAVAWLCRPGEQHDGDLDPHHSRHGRGSRSGGDLGDGGEGGDDHRRSEAHGERGADVGLRVTGDDDADRHNRDDDRKGTNQSLLMTLPSRRSTSLVVGRSGQRRRAVPMSMP